MNATEDRGRITARVSLSVEERLKEAAELTGATVNQFLVQAALEKADRIIDRERLITVTREDAAMLIAMLENPSKPNAALTRAFERYRTKAPNEQEHRRTRARSRRNTV
jgi:uncharacterized protein (DUF1778 family)